MVDAVKPAAFEYVQPRSVEETVSALHRFGEDAKVLAGGQSLVPMMNFRLARPSALVDIARVPGLDGIEVGDSEVVVGALVRHRRLELGGDVPGPLGSLLSAAGRCVGHLPIRTRGTFGGSIAHADPAAEWCVLATLMDADVLVASADGARSVPAESFFVTVFTTAIEPADVVTGIRMPLLGPDHRTGFSEFSRRAGDFAIVMAMVALQLRDDTVAAARIALGGVADRAVRATAAEAALLGAAPGREAFEEAGAIAARDVEPYEDVHGPPEYRRDLVRVMVRRALEQAVAA
jgi:carbon-monoxide dehydrogenase medium subunit